MDYIVVFCMRMDVAYVVGIFHQSENYRGKL